MSDVFEEVEEQVRRDRYAEWARKFGPWVLGAIALAAVGVGGYRLYEGLQRNQSQSISVEFGAAMKLVDEQKSDEAIAAFTKLAGEGPRNYRALAHMQLGALEVEAGDMTAALRSFDQAAEETRDPIARDAARLRAAYIVADTQDFTAVRARLEPLIAEGGAMSFLARELLGAEALEAGERDLARETFQGIADAFNAPESVQQRAQIALAVLGPADEAPAAPAAAPTTQEQPAPAAGEAK